MDCKPILFVWDFHGVLEKDNELAVLYVTNKVLKEYGYTACASYEDILGFYGLKWGDYYKQLVPGIEDRLVEEMVLRSREIGRPAAQKYIKPQDNAITVLQEIIKKGHRNIIVSNTEQKDLEFFIDLIGVKTLIEEYHGIGTKTHENKTEIIRKIASRDKIQKIVVIGDTEKDVEAGLSSKAVTYLFKPNGFNSETKAHHVIADLREVLKELR